jgi:hypothetical protein
MSNLTKFLKQTTAVSNSLPYTTGMSACRQKNTLYHAGSLVAVKNVGKISANELLPKP